jgi:hypothetical protein
MTRTRFDHSDLLARATVFFSNFAMSPSGVIVTSLS